MADEVVLPYPNIQLPQAAFILSQPNLSHLHAQAKKELLEGIENDDMAPYYETLTTGPRPILGSPDKSLLDRLRKKNADELAKIQAKLEDAETNLGETEISDALRSKAAYLARIGEKEEALKAHDAASEKTAGLGSRIDLALTKVRIGFFHSDHKVISENSEKSKELIDGGGDWDRRNRLKVYQGIHLLSIRDFKAGSALLLETLSTFTATELLKYEDFVQITVVAGVLSLDRKDMKKKIIEAPEVIQIAAEMPSLKTLYDSLYNTRYDHFFQALAEVEQKYLLPSRILSVHTRYYVREMRIKAYSQLLESYRSVTMQNFCNAFGVGESFIDADLSRFIAAGRLHCTIDKVNGIVETSRPDSKNALYGQVVKQGDGLLLNNIQRLSRVIG